MRRARAILTHAVALGVSFSLTTTAHAAWPPPGGPHPLWHGGNNQAGYPSIASTAVPDPVAAPIQLALRCWPNPSRGITRFQALANPGETIRVGVFSVSGRRVREWNIVGAGPRGVEWTWDARDGHGRATSPGLYFYRAESGKERVQGKFVLLARP
jgi:hypothetical protein